MIYELYDYFTGNFLLESDTPELQLGDTLKHELLPEKLMVFATNNDKSEALIAPECGGIPPLSFSFVFNQFTCEKCEMTFELGITKDKFVELHGRMWVHALNLTRTSQIIQIIDKSHHELCHLINPSAKII